MNKTHSTSKSFIEIQRLRGIAVLMVLYAHMDFIHIASGFSPYFWNSAAAGVDIFFVISGFVVGKNLFEHLELYPELSFLKRVEENVFRLKVFFVRRIFRLFPTVLLMAALTIIIRIHLASPFPYSPIEDFMGFLSYLSMQTDMDLILFAANGNHVRPDINHLWTLAVEERFYLIMPFVILAAGGTGRFMKLAIANIAFITFIKMFPLSESSMHYNGFLHFDAFLMGMLVYLVYRHSDIFQRCFAKTYRHTSQALVNVVVLLILLVAARLAICQITPDTEVDFLGSGYYYLCINFLACILITLAIQDKGYVLALPGFRRILEWAGDRSYTLYVFQFLYLLITDRLFLHFGITGRHAALHTIVYLAIMITGSEIIYRFWETPLREYGKRIAHGIGGPSS